MEWKYFLAICRRLNTAGVRYVLVGGFAIILHGYERITKDVDFIVDASADNIANIRAALQDLLPEATAELQVADVTQYTVVRMMDEGITVDLMKTIGEYDFEKVSQNIEIVEFEGVQIPLAGLETMIALKQGLRGKDHEDLLFLKGKKSYLEKQGKKKR